MIDLCIIVDPVAKGRPRFSNFRGFVRTYTPQKTLDFEQEVKKQLLEQYKGLPLNGALKMEITFYFGIPKSYSRKKIKELEKNLFLHTNKPDVDNLIKSFCDASNGILWDDDKQVCIIKASKLWTNTQPRISVSIEEL